MKPGDLIIAPFKKGRVSVWSEPPKPAKQSTLSQIWNDIDASARSSVGWSFERASRYSSIDEGSIGIILAYVDTKSSIELTSSGKLQLFYIKLVIDGLVGYTWAHYVRQI